MSGMVEHPPGTYGSAAPRSWPGSGLHVCPTCRRSDSVHASEQHRESDTRWQLRLRCGHCRGWRDVIVSDDLKQRFDSDVAHGLAAIADALTTLDRERMAHQVGAFTTALRHDLIDPADFGTSPSASC